MKRENGKSMLLSLFLFVVLFLGISDQAFGSVFKKLYVDASVTSSGTGESWAEAVKTIQEAIDKANSMWMQCYSPYNSIYVKAGTYSLSDTITIDKVASIYGGFPNTANPAFADRDWEAYPTIIDGNNAYQCIKAGVRYFLLDGFVIRNGFASFGGGLYTRKKTPVSCNSINGEYYMSPLLRNCKFISNTATSSGGAIYDGGTLDDGGADLRIVNCEFTNNHAKDGGAIYAVYSSPNISQSKFTGNTAESYGGALNGNWINQTTDALAYIINSVFYNNSAQAGGAIHSYIFYPRIRNCTFYQNSASIDGGGFHSFSYLINPADIQNSILWGNTPNQLVYSVSNTTYLKVDWNDIQGGWTPVANNINIDPGFAGATDFHLTEGSPCIDAGRSFSTYSYDIEGVARPQDGDFDGVADWDMGAFEFEGYEPDPDKDGDTDGKDLFDLANNFSLAKLVIFCDAFGSSALNDE
nr:choice-of-anchor Q domain-containing protein [uncultured Desulfobacter sp.]